MSLEDQIAGSTSQRIAGEDMKEALKIGLRAHYQRKGEPIEESAPARRSRGNLGPRSIDFDETTMAASVGDGPQSALGGPPPRTAYARNGAPTPKSKGIGVKDSVSQLQQALLDVKAAVAKVRGRLPESDIQRFIGAIADLSERILTGQSTSLQPAVIQAGIMESKFIASYQAQNNDVLGSYNDLGSKFREAIGEGDEQSIANIANDLSGGLPVSLVWNNVVAALGSTSNREIRETLRRALNVLQGFSS